MLNNIKGIIFDYGGTLDTNSTHWSEVLWEGFEHENVPVDKQQFREAYVYAERALAKNPLIKPKHNFLELLRIKVNIETSYLAESNYWIVEDGVRKDVSEAIAVYCNNYVLKVLEKSREVLRVLSEKYPLCLVSNFYGNIKTIIDDFDLNYFNSIIESAIVGVRKPDSRIFQLGVTALGLPAENIVVVGDSFSKDIVPANSIGCQTVWIKGIGWGDENDVDTNGMPTIVLSDIAQLTTIL